MIRLPRALALRALGALLAAVPATAQQRVRLAFDDDRIYTGALTLDHDGELVLDSDRLGGPAVVDFAAVERIERLDEAPAAGPEEVDRLSLLGMGRLHGELRAVEGDLIGFESRAFGPQEIPRSLAGDLVPRGLAGAEPAAAADGQGDRGGAAWADWEGFGQAARVDGLSAELEGRGARLSRRGDLTDHLVSVPLTWRGLPEFEIGLGGVSVRTWGGVPVLVGRPGGQLDVGVSPEPLGLDGGAILHLRVEGDERLSLESIERADGGRVEVGLGMALSSPPDELVIESFGRSMSVGAVDLRDPEELRDADGLVRYARPLRGSEVSGFDPATRRLQTPLGPTAFDRCPGVAFLPDERRGELEIARVEGGQGLFRTRSGEAVAVKQVLFEGGRFIVRTSFSSVPVEVPFDRLQGVRMPVGRGARGGAEFRMSFDGGAELVAGFIGVEREGGGYRVVRTEPGFKTPVRGGVAGQVWIERTTRSLFYASNRRFPHGVLLSDGQTLPAGIEEITDGSILLRTPFRDEPVRLAQADVRALIFHPRKVDFLLAELMAKPGQRDETRQQGLRMIQRADVAPVDRSLVTEERLERALLVPRAQKDDPGSHLLLARNGDLMRCNVVARDGDRLVVDGGAGGPMEVPLEVLAACVRIAPDPGGAGDPREAKIRTRRSTGDWTVNLGPGATLIGDLRSTEDGDLRLLHPLLGEITIPRDEFKRLDHGRGFAPRYRQLLDWRTIPMPEPSVAGG